MYVAADVWGRKVNLTFRVPRGGGQSAAGAFITGDEGDGESTLTWPAFVDGIEVVFYAEAVARRPLVRAVPSPSSPPLPHQPLFQSHFHSNVALAHAAPQPPPPPPERMHVCDVPNFVAESIWLLIPSPADGGGNDNVSGGNGDVAKSSSSARWERVTALSQLHSHCQLFVFQPEGSAIAGGEAVAKMPRPRPRTALMRSLVEERYLWDPTAAAEGAAAEGERRAEGAAAAVARPLTSRGASPMRGNSVTNSGRKRVLSSADGGGPVASYMAGTASRAGFAAAHSAAARAQQRQPSSPSQSARRGRRAQSPVAPSPRSPSPLRSQQQQQSFTTLRPTSLLPPPIFEAPSDAATACYIVLVRAQLRATGVTDVLLREALEGVLLGFAEAAGSDIGVEADPRGYSSDPRRSPTTVFPLSRYSEAEAAVARRRFRTLTPLLFADQANGVFAAASPPYGSEQNFPIPRSAFPPIPLEAIERGLRGIEVIAATLGHEGIIQQQPFEQQMPSSAPAHHNPTYSQSSSSPRPHHASLHSHGGSHCSLPHCQRARREAAAAAAAKEARAFEATAAERKRLAEVEAEHAVRAAAAERRAARRFIRLDGWLSLCAEMPELLWCVAERLFALPCGLTEGLAGLTADSEALAAAIDAAGGWQRFTADSGGAAVVGSGFSLPVDAAMGSSQFTADWLPNRPLLAAGPLSSPLENSVGGWGHHGDAFGGEGLRWGGLRGLREKGWGRPAQHQQHMSLAAAIPLVDDTRGLLIRKYIAAAQRLPVMQMQTHSLPQAQHAPQGGGNATLFQQQPQQQPLQPLLPRSLSLVVGAMPFCVEPWMALARCAHGDALEGLVAVDAMKRKARAETAMAAAVGGGDGGYFPSADAHSHRYEICYERDA